MSAKLRPYPAYKDSTMPWVEDIPNHWLMTPNRAMVSRRKILVGTAYNDYRLLSLTKAGVIVRDISTGRGKFSADMGTCQEVRHGDLVFCLFDVPETPRTVGLSTHDGMITGAYTVFECDDPVLARFLEAFYIAMDDRKLLSPLYSGLRKTIPTSRFLRTKTPVPTPAEQAAIVRFLDYADRRIRRYIRSKERLIELLEEQKQTIIHQAVTGQIDVRTGQPYPAYKDSGVEWLGKVPEHWKVLALKRVGRFAGGSGFPISAQGNVGGNILFAKVSDMNRPGNEHEIVTAANTVSSEVASTLKARVFGPGTIIFPKVGGALLTNKRRKLTRETCIDNNIMGCIVTGADLEFVFQMLRWLDLASIAKPGPVPAISEGEVREIRIGFPPREEQMTIVSYLRRVDTVYSDATRLAKREIELLQEYRTRLIADVVTGKLDVRGTAADLPEATPVADWSRDDTIHTESHPHAIEHDMAKEAIS